MQYAPNGAYDESIVSCSLFILMLFSCFRLLKIFCHGSTAQVKLLNPNNPPPRQLSIDRFYRIMMEITEWAAATIPHPGLLITVNWIQQSHKSYGTNTEGKATQPCLARSNPEPLQHAPPPSTHTCISISAITVQLSARYGNNVKS